MTALTRKQIEPLKVYLTGAEPAELANLLGDVGLQIVLPGDAERADLIVTFGTEPAAPVLMTPRLRLLIGHRGPAGPSASEPTGADFVAGNPIHAASYIVSWLFGGRMPMLTGDAATFRAIACALRVAALEVPVALEGETGTGKETLARLIHAAGGRNSAFVPVNCSMAAEGQWDDSRLAVSGEQDAGGREQAAPGGRTIFLDNVDELSPAMQERVLGEMRARRRDGESGVRYLASSSKPLREMAGRGLFNRELQAELARASVLLPPLRDRSEDISLLARDFLGMCDSRLRFTPGALRALSEYPFPGNVRELVNLVKRLAIVPLGASGGTIDAADVRDQIIVAARQKAERVRPTWHASVEAAKREIALRTVYAFGGDLEMAARRLGLSVTNLRRSVRSVRIVPPPQRRWR